jgi:uncharacterized cupin superfamily protein
VMFILSGSMTMRTPAGFEVAGEGSVVSFEIGETGAHQFYNHTGLPCTYFDVKTFYDLDVVVYPDSDKVMVSRYNEVFEKQSQVGYFEGEGEAKKIWLKMGYTFEKSPVFV